MSPAATSVVYASVVIYAACFQAQLPVQPYLVQGLSDDAVSAFTSLRTFIAILQLIGSLLSGYLIDRMGARRVLLLSLVSSSLSYAITAKASTLPLLFVAQAPTLFQHGVLAARAYMTTIVPAGAARATVIGRINICYGIGMIAGPYLGGLLAAYDITYSALFAAIGSMASVVLVLLYLPDNAVDICDASPPHSKSVDTSAVGYGALLSIPRIIPALAVKSILYAALAIFTSAVQLLSLERFALDAAAMGQVLSFFGFFSILASSLVPVVRARMAPTTALILSSSIFAISLLAFSSASKPEHIFLLTVPQAISSTLFTIINSGELSGLCPSTIQGSLHAADMALSSGLRIISPIASALLIRHLGFASIGYATGSLALLVAALLAGGIGTADA